MSKVIRNHPAVESVGCARFEGFDSGKYSVELKPGWYFEEHLENHGEYCSWGKFNSVREFHEARPKKK